MFDILSHPQTRIIILETLFAKVNFSPLEFCFLRFNYNCQFRFQLTSEFEKLTEMPLLDTFQTGLLKFSQSLVNLPSLKQETREIKQLRKYKATKNYFVSIVM